MTLNPGIFDQKRYTIQMYRVNRVNIRLTNYYLNVFTNVSHSYLNSRYTLMCIISLLADTILASKQAMSDCKAEMYYILWLQYFCIFLLLPFTYVIF